MIATFAPVGSVGKTATSCSEFKPSIRSGLGKNQPPISAISTTAAKPARMPATTARTPRMLIPPLCGATICPPPETV
jgi:hypothetical protein